MDDVEAAYMALTVRNDTHTAHVASTGDHDGIASIKLDKLGDLALIDVVLDRVVDLDGWVGVADCAAVVGHDEGYAARTNGQLFHLAKLVGRLFRRDAVDCEAALDVVQQAEVFSRLFDRDHVCAAKLGDNLEGTRRSGP
jgi:hypothetical protein